MTTTSAAPSDSLLGVYRRAPMEFVRGAGVELFDADGKAYLDFVAGIAVNALGYGDEGLERAMREAMESGLVHVSNLYRTSPGERLAAKLAEHSFADRVFFCNSGAEANEGAFKIARRWGRSTGGSSKHEIVALRGAFHGRLFGTLAATDRPQYRAPFRPLVGGISIVERDLDERVGVVARLRLAHEQGKVGEHHPARVPLGRRRWQQHHCRSGAHDHLLLQHERRRQRRRRRRLRRNRADRER